MARDPDYDRVSRKAHELWEAEGRPHGRDQAHWDEAREIIAIEDSQGNTLLPRDFGAQEPIEDAEEALRNQADFPNLTDQGENLLTSTDREPELVATPSGKKGRMPKAEVPISDQPGIPPKGKKAAASAKSEVPAASAKPPVVKPAAAKSAPVKLTSKPAMPAAAPVTAGAKPKTASIPKVSQSEAVKSSPPPKQAAIVSTKK